MDEETLTVDSQSNSSLNASKMKAQKVPILTAPIIIENTEIIETNNTNEESKDSSTDVESIDVNRLRRKMFKEPRGKTSRLVVPKK